MDNEEVIQRVLAHHGVKGMKWGVSRRGGSSGGSRSSGEVSVKTRSHPQAKTVIRTKGGKGLSAHPDAIAAKVVQQKLNKSGTHALSNSELRTFTERRQLEENTKRLKPDTPLQAGAKHVTQFLKTPEGQKQAMTVVSKLSKKKLAKGAAKVAMTAALA
jgi:hypothetical protein